MTRIKSILVGAVAACTLGAISAPATAQEQLRSEHSFARREAEAGKQLRLRDIERRILPMEKGAKYIGPAYDPSVRAYRLKFMKDGRVTYVDVDARTGRIIGRVR